MDNKNSEIIHRWYDEVWNNSNGSVINELLHPETNAYGLGAQPIVGTAGFTSFYDAFNNTYSDIHVTVDKTLVDGDYVTALCTVHARYRKSGKPVSFTGASITRIQNGQIIEAWNHFDFLTLNLQIGKISEEQLT